jgi:hypothetical protein
MGVRRRIALAVCLCHPASPHFVYHILFMVARTSFRRGSKGDSEGVVAPCIAGIK